MYISFVSLTIYASPAEASTANKSVSVSFAPLINTLFGLSPPIVAPNGNSTEPLVLAVIVAPFSNRMEELLRCNSFVQILFKRLDSLPKSYTPFASGITL